MSMNLKHNQSHRSIPPDALPHRGLIHFQNNRSTEKNITEIAGFDMFARHIHATPEDWIMANAEAHRPACSGKDGDLR